MFIQDKNDLQKTVSPPAHNHYVVYGWEHSYFTRKLEAGLHFYGTSFERRRIGDDIRQEVRLRAGTHQIPVLHTSENWMLADTTPILMLLDHRFPQRALYPEGPMGALVHILEEYFDEWIARTSVHWRWAYKENHALLSMDATDGDPESAAALAGWGRRVCRATGVSSDVQQREAEAEYHRILAAAEQQLQTTDYLLGDRPTALDCIVLGGLRAHFNHDPAPRRAIHDRYPIVIDWCERRADCWEGQGSVLGINQLTEFASFVLQEMAQTYKPFVLANRKALLNKEKAFVIAMYGEDVSYLARPYIEQSRQMIVHRLHRQLRESQREHLNTVLLQHQLDGVFTE